MRNHVIFKFLAIALCALCLMGAIVSGGSLIMLASLELEDGQSPREKQWESLEQNLQWDARSYVARYVTREKGAVDETFLAKRYSSLNYDYQIRNSRGKVVDETFTLTGGFTEFTCTVHAGTVSYDAAVSGPVYAKWPDWEQTREAMAEEYRTEHPDAEFTTIGFSVPNTNGENYYIVEERPTTEDYTVVFHIDTAGIGSTQEQRPWAIADALWRHETMVVAVLGTSLVLFAALAVYLCMAAGRKPGSEEIRPGGLNCIPLDIYLAAVVLGAFGYVFCAAESLGYFIQQSMLIFLSIYGYGLYAWCLLCVGFCFACAAQFKTPNFYWWRRSVTGLCWRIVVWCWHFGWKCLGWAYKILWTVTIGLVSWAWKTIKKLFSWLIGWVRKLYGLLPLSWQWLVGGLLVGGCTFPGLLWDSNLLLFISFAIALAVVIYSANVYATLLEAAKRMRGGDLEIKVDEKLMIGGFKDMAQELNGLSDVVMVAAQKQMRSERMRTELITNVSHDIKTPLTSIINYVDLLQKPHSPEDGQAYLEVLSRQSNRMKRLIDDLIELSKASTGNITVNLTTMDAVETVNQALGEFTDKLEAAHLMPVFRAPKEPLYIHADGRLAWRAMSNLLSNAAKYAQPDTRLYVDMVAVDGKVCISFKNISRDSLNISADELMERFVRGEASRSQEGSGLGLNIAKSMMELQHGALELLVDGDLFKATLIFPQEV
ncbi:MAG: HAMP domain-containing histidine kinase [Clostridiales bacterium]|nr:HAMP domain-containing histidine kinase [Clostridiales bacterium]